MTPLQQTALDFCRECLGWERAELDGRQPFVWQPPWGKHFFWYENLTPVVQAVRGWCSENDLFLSTCTMPTLKAVSAQVFRHDMRIEVEHTDFGHAIIAGCVAANRKLKGISHD